MKKQLIQVPVGVSLHLRYLCQDEGLNGKQLLEKYPKFSKATIYLHGRKSHWTKTFSTNEVFHRGFLQ